MQNSCVPVIHRVFSEALISVFYISSFLSHQDSGYSLWWAGLGSNPKKIYHVTLRTTPSLQPLSLS